MTMGRGDLSAGRLYDAARGWATTRQRRLLMVAACRVRSGEFYDPRFDLVLDAAERCADDTTDEAAARARWEEVVSAAEPRIPDGEVVRAVSAAWDLALDVGNQTEGGRFSPARSALARAVLLCLRVEPGAVFNGGDGDAVDCCLRALLDAGSPGRSGATGKRVRMAGVRAAVAKIVRDILGGNPRSVAFVPSWRTSTCVALARQMYESRDFSVMPILADALQDAGCANDDVLNHCRDVGVHVRGCWVVDLLLVKGEP